MKKVLTMLAAALVCAAAPSQAAPRHRLLLVSIDGLDWRYLRDRDAMGLQIPTLRKLLARAQVADGVTGVWPTITWPSHTTMLTGQPPFRHGILANAGGPPDITQSYWSATKIKVPTLTQCAAKAGLTTAAINWPVTVDAAITWNLPEVYAKRDGDSSDLETVERHATPGLVAEITHAHPSFAYRWFDDRTKTVAAVYLLTAKHPDLLMIHLAETDSEQHAEGPFTPHAKAVLERSDELLGDLLTALPRDYDVAVVSDHGFEAVDRVANLRVMAAADGVTGPMTVTGGLVSTTDGKVADWLRGQSGKGDVGREVPHDELLHFGGFDAVAAFEPAPHVMFGNAAGGPAHTPSREKGNHGFWPTRPDYRSVFLLSGPGVKPASLGTIDMLSLKDRFAGVLGLTCE
ncbi:MAG TPA: ectonucleotide pyrophosphatase/phosphodiesterase [Rhizomicrobium sp.]|nr:ectonucleotide pyrophosphatase/phosphodiesterase [Rhizomicrobium sp.]